MASASRARCASRKLRTLTTLLTPALAAAFAIIGTTAAASGAPVPAGALPKLTGIDVSSNQGVIDWTKVATRVNFVYAKATEGTYYVNPDFNNQYEGPYDHGLIRGAYHFAIPNKSSGAAQADYFIAHGGGWSADGRTLPGTLDIEYDPYGKNACYGLTRSQMVGWIRAFTTQYAAKERVYPVIYSTTDWWKTCTGDYAGLASQDPFWVANYSVKDGGPLPAGWGYFTFWQCADKGLVPGDQDVFNGALTQLRTLAVNG